MNIFVISGFLGAGKTTFIKTLSEKTGKEFAVMENEYGETGIDGALLKQDRLKVWELTEGCICCSLKSDFASSILTIANTLNPEYLIVEPTGVGLLSAVLHNIGKIEYNRIRLLEPVTVVDVHCVDHYLKEFMDIYTDQLKNTQRILLSKIENISAEDLSRVSALIRTVNPDAEILNTPSLYRRKTSHPIWKISELQTLPLIPLTIYWNCWFPFYEDTSAESTVQKDLYLSMGNGQNSI